MGKWKSVLFKFLPVILCLFCLIVIFSSTYFFYPTYFDTLTGVSANIPFLEEEQNDNGDKININTAPIEELMILQGIGEKRAIAIVEYRNAHGEFKSISDLMKISGIGEKLFSEIKEFICV